MGKLAFPELTDQLGFLTTRLPAPPARALDAGCGRGALARALLNTGRDRYLGGWIDPAIGPTVVTALRAVETLRVEQSGLRPIGLRIVARRTPGPRR